MAATIRPMGRLTDMETAMTTTMTMTRHQESPKTLASLADRPDLERTSAA
jgi:hypothetical protein